MIFSDWPWRHWRQVREKPSPYVLMTSNSTGASFVLASMS